MTRPAANYAAEASRTPSLNGADQVARRAAKGSHGGRPPAFDKQVYRQRNVVERCFNRLKQWRALATRYAKRAAIHRSSLLLIAVLIRLR